MDSGIFEQEKTNFRENISFMATTKQFIGACLKAILDFQV